DDVRAIDEVELPWNLGGHYVRLDNRDASLTGHGGGSLGNLDADPLKRTGEVRQKFSVKATDVQRATPRDYPSNFRHFLGILT
ncbi:MAG: hypothetical protein ACI9OJ_003285, partial [Myxococcota bacterium]